MPTDLSKLKQQMYDIYDKYTLQAETAKKEGNDRGIVRAQAGFDGELSNLISPILDTCPEDMYSDEMPEHKLWMEFLLETEVKGGLIGA